MAQFQDLKGRTWTLAIDGSHVLAAKRTFGVNIPGLFAEDNRPLLELTSDFERFVGVLWLLLEQQVDREGVDLDEFVRGLAGDTLGRAIEAFVEALIDFFPTAAQRAAIRELWKLSKMTGTHSMEAVAEVVRNQRTIIDSSLSAQRSPE